MSETVRKDISMLRKMNLIFRFSYTLPFFLASLCGSVLALSYSPSLWMVILIPLTVQVLAVFVNFSNDYFDHGSGVDSMRYEMTKNHITDSEVLNKIYWEGNQFDTGMITEKQGRIVMAIIVGIVAIMSIPIVAYSGWKVIILGLIGLFFAYFYTAPPLNLGARGLGETVVGISFLMIVACTFYVLTGTITQEVIIASLIIGIALGTMRMVDSMSAQDAHIANHEVSVSVILGINRTIPIVRFMILSIYVLAVCLSIFNPAFLLIFLSLPLSYKAWKIMQPGNGGWEIKVIPYFFGISMAIEVFVIISALISMAI